jgi:alpha-N-arabinofuranosidase
LDHIEFQAVILLLQTRGSQPKVNAGIDTYPLDAAAALSEDRKTISVAVINPTESEQTLNLDSKGLELTSKRKVWRMAPSDLSVTIVAGQKSGVEAEETAVEAKPERSIVPPFSVSIYELAVE